MRKYFWSVFKAWSQLLNALVGGSEDTTFSSRCEIATVKGKLWGRLCKKVVNLLFFWQEGDHCKKALVKDIRRGRTAIKYMELYVKE